MSNSQIIRVLRLCMCLFVCGGGVAIGLKCMTFSQNIVKAMEVDNCVEISDIDAMIRDFVPYRDVSNVYTKIKKMCDELDMSKASKNKESSSNKSELEQHEDDGNKLKISKVCRLFLRKLNSESHISCSMGKDYDVPVISEYIKKFNEMRTYLLSGVFNIDTKMGLQVFYGKTVKLFNKFNESLGALNEFAEYVKKMGVDLISCDDIGVIRGYLGSRVAMLEAMRKYILNKCPFVDENLDGIAFFCYGLDELVNSGGFATCGVIVSGLEEKFILGKGGSFEIVRDSVFEYFKKCLKERNKLGEKCGHDSETWQKYQFALALQDLFDRILPGCRLFEYITEVTAKYEDMCDRFFRRPKDGIDLKGIEAIKKFVRDVEISLQDYYDDMTFEGLGFKRKLKKSFEKTTFDRCLKEVFELYCNKIREIHGEQHGQYVVLREGCDFQRFADFISNLADEIDNTLADFVNVCFKELFPKMVRTICQRYEIIRFGGREDSRFEMREDR